MLSQAQSHSRTSASPSSALLDRKIEECTAGLAASTTKRLYSISRDNAATIVHYLEAMKTEVNLSDHYRKDLIELLSKLSKYNDNIPFKDLTRANILGFLDSHRKSETKDPLHKWVGTYNLFRVHLFKWLYSPDIEPDKRAKPSITENIPKLRRKETSIYKPSRNIDLLFLQVKQQIGAIFLYFLKENGLPHLYHRR